MGVGEVKRLPVSFMWDAGTGSLPAWFPRARRSDLISIPIAALISLLALSLSVISAALIASLALTALNTSIPTMSLLPWASFAVFSGMAALLLFWSLI
jgi:hypothetical protein